MKIYKRTYYKWLLCNRMIYPIYYSYEVKNNNEIKDYVGLQNTPPKKSSYFLTILNGVVIREWEKYNIRYQDECKLFTELTDNLKLEIL